MGMTTYNFKLTIDNNPIPVYDYPDLGSDREGIDDTTTTDAQKVFLMGIGEMSPLTFNARGTSSLLYTLRSYGPTTAKTCKIEFQDGYYYEFDAYIDAHHTAAAVNERVAFAVTLYPTEELELTAPAAG